MSSKNLTSAMKIALDKRRDNSTLRSLHQSPPGLIDFSSNDFLSLSTSPLTRQKYFSSLANTLPSEFRLGSGGSRLLDGNSIYAETLEIEIAKFHHAPSALLFTSGFDANSGLFSCIPQRGDIVLHDSLIHASVRQGLKLSRASITETFSHNSLVDLERKISHHLENNSGIVNGTTNIFIAIEALYSMDGDLAPLDSIIHLVNQMLPKGNGYLIVDEAHSNGIYGESGRGLACHLGVEDKIFARLHTFGKALACNGAVILCDKLVREYLINYAKPLIYTTALSFPSLVAINSVYELMRQGVTRSLISRLNDLMIHLFHHLMITVLPLLTTRTGDDTTTPMIIKTKKTTTSISEKPILILPVDLPKSPIFSILTRDPRSLANYCQTAGFLVRPIMPPTVPQHTQRVRICLHAGNTFIEVESLVQCIKNWLERELIKDSNNTNLLDKKNSLVKSNL